MPRRDGDKVALHTRLLTSAPVDRVAARVMRQGIHFEPNARHADGDYYHGIVPPKEAPRPHLPNWKDLRGQRLGRMTVVGWLGKARGKKGRWSMRCDCGMYEVRSTPAIVHASDPNEACYQCRYLDKIKAGSGHAFPKAD